MVVYPNMVDNVAFLFNCTTVRRSSDYREAACSMSFSWLEIDYQCCGRAHHGSVLFNHSVCDCTCLLWWFTDDSFADQAYTVDSRYLEIQGTLWNTSRYPYFDISDLRKWAKQLFEQSPLTEWICNLTPKFEIYWKYCGKEEKLLSSFPQYFAARG